jgi:hypothetical protein
MQRFKSVKTPQEIAAEIKKRGWPIDITDYDKGGDTITFGTPIVKAGKKVDFGHTVLNVFNGEFQTFSGDADHKVIATNRSEIDGTPWYDDLLRIIYNA